MLFFLKILFWLCILSLVHSYVFYPLIVKLLSKGKNNNNLIFAKQDQLPMVSVIMSVYNEEQVIEKKMESLLELNYPKARLKIYVGSDCSDDDTNPKMEYYKRQDSKVNFIPFNKRRGKPDVVNDLIDLAFQEHAPQDNHLLLMTDASVILQEDTLFQLVKHFKNKAIVLVDANMVNVGMKPDGISKVEDEYITSEVKLKHLEGIAFGKMVGPFGGCFVIRSNYFSKIPPKYLVDDFYIAMRAFEKGGLAINEMNAKCFEAVSHDLNEEYRRKSRISAGNFQNLATFRHLLWKVNALSFAFFSHKVLRWLGPFFIIFAFLSSGILAMSGNFFYMVLFFFQILFLVATPLLDLLLKKFKINVLAFRKVRYFTMMNVALLEGFIKYINGIKNNVWQPPKRN
jgi:cellulose synthase/poly-beta-1,6-N-acetylglucosamine synthase-like glycosyltransferase